MTDKTTAMRELDEAWTELFNLVQQVPEDDATRPGLVNDWSLKDLLGHLAFWSGRAVRTVRCAEAGRPQDVEVGQGPGWVDEWNQREYEARKAHTFHELRAECMRNYEDACKALKEASAESLDTRLFGETTVRDIFAGDTYEHYREHAEHIKDWLRQTETSEE